MSANFKAGDKVQYCGDEAAVVSNWGNSGTVRLSDGNLCRWYWIFDGEAVTLVTES